MSTIRVLVYAPGRPGEVCELVAELAEMQAAVGGYIEMARYAGFPAHLVIICNEYGRLDDLPPNRLGVRGTFFVARREGGELVSLTDADIAAVTLAVSRA